jgi:hypothetical protein
LPDGRSLEVKLDLRSQARGYAAIEAPSLARHADFYTHTLCYYLIFPGDVYEMLYNQKGKIPERKGSMGDQNYDGRLIPVQEMRGWGMWPSRFVRELTLQQ